MNIPNLASEIATCHRSPLETYGFLRLSGFVALLRGLCRPKAAVGKGAGRQSASDVPTKVTIGPAAGQGRCNVHGRFQMPWVGGHRGWLSTFVVKNPKVVQLAGLRLVAVFTILRLITKPVFRFSSYALASHMSCRVLCGPLDVRRRSYRDGRPVRLARRWSRASASSGSGGDNTPASSLSCVYDGVDGERVPWGSESPIARQSRETNPYPRPQ